MSKAPCARGVGGNGCEHTIVGTSRGNAHNHARPDLYDQTRTIESLLQVTLIILDVLGFAPLDDSGTQLLSWLVAGAHEHY